MFFAVDQAYGHTQILPCNFFSLSRGDSPASFGGIEMQPRERKLKDRKAQSQYP